MLVSSCQAQSQPLNNQLAPPPDTGTRHRHNFDPAGCLVVQCVTNGKVLLSLQAPVLNGPSLHPTQISALLRRKVSVSGSKRYILASKKSCKSGTLLLWSLAAVHGFASADVLRWLQAE